MSIRSPPLELNGERGKEDDLDCSAGCILRANISTTGTITRSFGATLLTQKGPETPYRYATPDDCSSVAAQVQEETTADATRPDLTVLPAVLNISEVWDSLLYLRCTTHSLETVWPGLESCDSASHLFKTQVVRIIPRANRKPRPMMMP